MIMLFAVRYSNKCIGYCTMILWKEQGKTDTAEMEFRDKVLTLFIRKHTMLMRPEMPYQKYAMELFFG